MSRTIGIAIIGLPTTLAILSVWISAIAFERVAVVLLELVLCIFGLVLIPPLAAFARRKGHRILPLLAISFGAVGCMISVATLHWPLKEAYRLSRNSFNELAFQVRAGKHLNDPERVGVFKIKRAEVYYNGIVCLWTDTDAGGKTGFVQCNPDHVPFNLWSMITLDDQWQFISED